MPRQQYTADERLKVKTSSLYYLRDLTQQQIADRLHLSRPKVSRLLQQARRDGIVQISVASLNGTHLELEDEMESLHGLEEVVIIEADPKSDSIQILKRDLGAAAADYFQRTAQGGDVLGVTWGTTLRDFVQNVPASSSSDIHVVQALGGVGPPEAEAHGADLSRRLAKRIGGSLTLIPAPGIAANARSRAALLADPHVQSALSMFSKMNTAYIGIGALTTNPLLDRNAVIGAEDLDELRRSGAVGDIGLRFFDAEGAPVRTALDKRIIGISLEELKQVQTVVGVAGGPEKVEAIRAAIIGGYVDVLITDSVTATRILEPPSD